MDNVTEGQRILTEKISDSWSRCLDNFKSEGEITLTITLNEYRKLVSTSATTKALVDEANKDKYKREDENRKLLEENAKLKAEIYELSKKLETATEENQEREE